MTVRFDSLRQTVAVFGAVMFTAVLVLASTPFVPVA